MSMGEREGDNQDEFWIPVQDIVWTEGHPLTRSCRRPSGYYELLNSSSPVSVPASPRKRVTE